MFGSLSYTQGRAPQNRGNTLAPGQRSGPGGWGVPRRERDDASYSSSPDSSEDEYEIGVGDITTEYQPDVDEYYENAYGNNQGLYADEELGSRDHTLPQHADLYADEELASRDHTLPQGYAGDRPLYMYGDGSEHGVDSYYGSPGRLDTSGHDWEARLPPASSSEDELTDTLSYNNTSFEYSPELERGTDSSDLSSGEMRRDKIRSQWVLTQPRDDDIIYAPADPRMDPLDVVDHELSETAYRMASVGQMNLTDQEQCAFLFRLYQKLGLERVDPGLVSSAAYLGEGVATDADGTFYAQRRFDRDEIVAVYGGYIVPYPIAQRLQTARLGHAFLLPRYWQYLRDIDRAGTAVDGNPCLQASRDHERNNRDSMRAPGALALRNAQRSVQTPVANVHFRVLKMRGGRVPVIIASERIERDQPIVLSPSDNPRHDNDSEEEEEENEQREQMDVDDSEWPESPTRFPSRALGYGRAHGGARASTGASLYSYMDSAGKWQSMQRFVPAKSVCVN